MPNSLVDLQKFFSTPEKPVRMIEMKEFWDSLTDEEKLEFKAAELPKD
jgi:hypothetical protein